MAKWWACLSNLGRLLHICLPCFIFIMVLFYYLFHLFVFFYVNFLSFPKFHESGKLQWVHKACYGEAGWKERALGLNTYWFGFTIIYFQKISHVSWYSKTPSQPHYCPLKEVGMAGFICYFSHCQYLFIFQYVWKQDKMRNCWLIHFVQLAHVTYALYKYRDDQKEKNGWPWCYLF